MRIEYLNESCKSFFDSMCLANVHINDYFNIPKEFLLIFGLIVGVPILFMIYCIVFDYKKKWETNR
jgi:uncharacterized protein (UPF0333 family)